MSDETATTEPETAKTVRKIEVKALIDARQLKKDMAYTVTDLSTAMMEQGSLFVHYGVLAAKATRQVDQLKLTLENMEAKAYRKFRDDAITAGAKMSEPALAAAVALHPQVLEFKKAVNEAKQIEAQAKIATEGFRHRRDMLIQQGLLTREEMKGELSIAARGVSEQAGKDQRERLAKRLREAGQSREGEEIEE